MLREPRVPKPNRSGCGFWNGRRIRCRLVEKWSDFECDIPAFWMNACPWGRIARALYKRQQEEASDA